MSHQKIVIYSLCEAGLDIRRRISEEHFCSKKFIALLRRTNCQRSLLQCLSKSQWSRYKKIEKKDALHKVCPLWGNYHCFAGHTCLCLGFGPDLEKLGLPLLDLQWIIYTGSSNCHNHLCWSTISKHSAGLGIGQTQEPSFFAMANYQRNPLDSAGSGLSTSLNWPYCPTS